MREEWSARLILFTNPGLVMAARMQCHEDDTEKITGKNLEKMQN